jgi:hypothetical protein
VYDKDLIDTVKVEHNVFKGYNGFMRGVTTVGYNEYNDDSIGTMVRWVSTMTKGNDIYLLTTILDPRIKTQ